MASGYPPPNGLGPISPAPGLGGGPPGIGRSPPGEAPPPPPAGLGSSNPPGLWQPPGFAGLGAGGPPPPAPPPAPGSAGPGAAANASAAHGAIGEGRELELQKEISGTIEAQVQRLIEQARHDTEAKVKTELKMIHDAIKHVDSGIDGLMKQLEGIEPQEQQEQPMDAEAIGQLLSKIEMQWGQEIRTLKQELHQTILAHNHNADLIKHHKDTIDALRERCVKMQNNNAKTSEIQQQLQKLDARLKQQQKQRKLEPLFERLSALEQRVAAAATGGAAAAWRYPGIPPIVPPGMPVPPGIPPGMMPGLGATAAQANMMASLKAAKAQAAYKCPTDEEATADAAAEGTAAVEKHED